MSTTTIQEISHKGSQRIIETADRAEHHQHHLHMPAGMAARARIHSGHGQFSQLLGYSPVARSPRMAIIYQRSSVYKLG
jgi:hypothetical protein